MTAGAQPKRPAAKRRKRVDPVVVTAIAMFAATLALLLVTVAVRPVTAGPPGSEWLAYGSAPFIDAADADWDVWVVPVDGSKPPVNLTHRSGFDGAEGWSDEGAVLYRRAEGAKVDLWQVNFDGSWPRRVVAGDWILQGAWSPDVLSNRLAYIEAGDENPGLYISEGPGPQRVSSAPVARFDWSPNGAELAVLLVDGRVLLVDPVDGTSRELVSAEPTDFPRIAWSSDGSHIAFTSGQSPEVGLRVVALQTGKVEVVTGSVGAFHWSVDGQGVVFVEGGGRGPLLLWRRATGGTATIDAGPVGFSAITPNGVGIFEVEGCAGCAEGTLLRSALEQGTRPLTTDPAVYGPLFIWPTH